MKVTEIINKTLSLGLFAGVLVTASGTILAGKVSAAGLTEYDHIFLIVNENHNYDQVIGSPSAPNINAFAQQYGLANRYFGVTHPSQPNYVAITGGNFYNVTSDGAYYQNTVDEPSIFSQLDGSSKSWKIYANSIPYDGFTGTQYPANPVPNPNNIDAALYASKHIPALIFADTQAKILRSNQPGVGTTAYGEAHLVQDNTLISDLQNNTVPRFSLIIPDLCNDAHGGNPVCPFGSYANGNPLEPDTAASNLIAYMDNYTGKTVQSITSSSLWHSSQNNAIIITGDECDESDNPQCPNRVSMVVVANHGPLGLVDSTYYNHYSLTGTLQELLGLSDGTNNCLGNSCSPWSTAATNAAGSTLGELINGNGIFGTTNSNAPNPLAPLFQVNPNVVPQTFIATTTPIIDTTVPEPSSVLGIIAVGIGGFLGGRKRKSD